MPINLSEFMGIQHKGWNLGEESGGKERADEYKLTHLNKTTVIPWVNQIYLMRRLDVLAVTQKMLIANGQAVFGSMAWDT